MSFYKSDENPNETTGGGGCLCHPRGSSETCGPFLIFPATSTDDNLSPHAVLCAHCAEEGLKTQPEEVIDLPDDSFEELDTVIGDTAPVVKI